MEQKEQLNIEKLIIVHRLQQNKTTLIAISPLVVGFSVILLLISIYDKLVLQVNNTTFLIVASALLFIIYFPLIIIKHKIKYTWWYFVMVIMFTMIALSLVQINEIKFYGHIYSYILGAMFLIAVFIISLKDLIIFGIFSFLTITAIFIIFMESTHLVFGLTRVYIALVIIFVLGYIRNKEFRKGVIQREQLSRLTVDIEIKNKLLDSSLMKLKEETKAKTEYVSNVSHELKTPITILNGYVDLFKKDERLSDERSQKRLHVMEKNVKRLFNTVSDLFNIGELAKSTSAINIAPFPVREIFASLLEEFRDLCNKEGRIFEYEIDDVQVFGDSPQLAIVLENLLLNALKFTSENSLITVSIREDSENRVKFSVEDNGLGISSDEQEKIFLKFYQSAGGLDRKFPGTGLGLYISNQILKGHKSELRVRSATEQGSEFYFFLKKTGE